MTKKTFNVFISHYHKDEADLNKLTELLKRNSYSFRNSSIDSSKPNQAKNPEYIKGILRSRINWASALVVLIGPNTHKREWVNWEIDYAHRSNKKIIGVFINGAKDSDIPNNLEKYGDSVVGWQTDKIIGAINGSHTDWTNPEGGRRGNKWDSGRLNC